MSIDKKSILEDNNVITLKILSGDNSMQTNGILGLIILLADIFAIFKIIKSAESTVMKILWVAIVLILPVIGLIVWFFAGPGDKALKL